MHLNHRGLIELFLAMATEASSEAHPARPFITDRFARVGSDRASLFLQAQAQGPSNPGGSTSKQPAITISASAPKWLVLQGVPRGSAK